MGRARPTIIRVLEKIQVSEGQFWENTPCWNWTGGRNSYGYGGFILREGKLRTTIAHRAVYLLLVGDIPQGLDLDHGCCNRSCVSPFHLRPMTHEENMRRANEMRTHCKRGHLMDEENTAVVVSSGVKRCRACSRARLADWRKKNPEGNFAINRRYYLKKTGKDVAG